ncbi:MAG TPA: hypothetical protein VMY42_11165 [Thermoguttaceae bacterium]|nr:hypothetical protein [Thermoguttaceae bacterium]
MKKETVSRRDVLKTGSAGLGLALAGMTAGELQAAGPRGAKKPQKIAFHHAGIPTTKKQEDETYLEESKVYITDPEKHPFGIEWCRWMPDSEAPELLRTTTHLAFKVDDVEAKMAEFDKEIWFIEPFVPFEGAKVGFINFEGTLIEFLQKSEK